jgi:hypothetical protein
MTRSRILARRFVLPLAAVGALACSLCWAAPALATVGWSVHSVADPTRFAPNDKTECASVQDKCDRYQLVVLNTGDNGSTGPITVTDVLPAGLTGGGISQYGPEGESWSCSGETTVVCNLSDPVLAGAYAPVIEISVSAPEETSGTLINNVTVEGGETATTPEASTSEETEIDATAAPFEVSDFSLEAVSANGSLFGEAAGHPSAVATSIDLADAFTPPGTGGAVNPVMPVEQAKDVVVELPAGFVGDPLATPRCPLYVGGASVETALNSEEFEAICGAAKSEVGVIAFDGAGSIRTSLSRHRNTPATTTPIFNMSPEAGYPAELSFAFAGNAVNLYATVVHTGSGYRLRVAAAGIPTVINLVGVTLAFFGDAARRDGLEPHTAFLTNPADCSQGPLEAKVEANSWEHPANWVSKTTVSYPQIEDCNLLQFEPRLQVAPSSAEGEGSSQADEPSAYDVNLEVPQRSLFEETATPDLKDASVTLPEGVSVSPSAADGLEGCPEHGPDGIDMPSGERHPDEAGEGEEIGPDGLSHLVAGHCPKASTLGTVEIVTPLLEEPLKGHVYLAQPKCGGSGQPACTEASATNGELYGLYIEAAGSGVVIKLPGTVSANPSTGQLTGTFSENPQLPFSDLRIHFHGGPRAPIANPQTCGSYATSSTLTSWAGQEVAGVSPSFGVDWDGHGGACPASVPFAPVFSAGTTATEGGAFTPFLLSFSRQDREQDLAGLSVTLPPGLLAKIAGIPLCGEAQANAGTCGAESQLGSASVLAGPGEHPLYVSGGRVYLTTGYGGGPFGLSIVVPAVAGPFNLGNVVVRAAIHINPETSQVTVTTDPLPQSRDGVPFRLRTVYTEINRSGFTFNPTNCAQQPITGTITGSRGAGAGVSSPFAATGCAGLAFKPAFSASTQGKASKANGASLVVKVASGAGQANIAKVDLQLPEALPSRLTTLQKACLAAVFESNPAACDEGSVIGYATIHTPVLTSPLSGPAYLVSRGGAAFPDVEFVLQGEGVTIVLDGKTDIKNGITYSRFESLPDAPFTTFETVLPTGPHSILGAYVPVKDNYSLCGQTLTMPTVITGQNGAQVTQSTDIAVTGCGKPSIKITKAKIKGNTVLVTVTTTQQGTVTVSGNGLKTIKKTLAAGAHQLKVSLTKNGRTASKHHRKTKVKASVNDSNGSSSKTMSLKL